MLIQFYGNPFPAQNNTIKKGLCDSSHKLDFLTFFSSELQDISVKLIEGKS